MWDNSGRNGKLQPGFQERLLITPSVPGRRISSAYRRGRFASGLIDIVGKDWRDCKIAHPGPIGCTGRRPRLFVHVCIDDTSRVAFVQISANQRKKCAVAFLEAAVAYFAKLGIRVERVMTDNGWCYRSKTFRAARERLGLRQIFTRPYTPKTNGKAERFIQTALREWAYARAYQYSDQRSAELLNWLHRYNGHRPHGRLKAKTPITYRT